MDFVLKTVQFQKIVQQHDQAKCNNKTRNAATDIFLQKQNWKYSNRHLFAGNKRNLTQKHRIFLILKFKHIA